MITLSLPIINEQFGIKTLGTAAGVTATLDGAKAVDCTKHSGMRYTVLNANVKTNDNDDTVVTRTFTKSDFHALIKKTLVGNLTITAYDNNFSATPVLEIELPDEALAD